MQRVVILGTAGAGKTVLANEIARRTGLPIVHLDVLFWRPGWAPAPREEALRELRAAIAGDRWVLDGNFLHDEGARFERADTVVFLDLPRAICLRRTLARVVRDRGRRRPDLPAGCEEGFNLELLRWIWRYPRDDRPRIVRLLAGLADQGVAVHHLRSPRDVERFLASI